MARAVVKGKIDAGAPGQDRDVPQMEKDAVGALLKRIERAKTLRKEFNETTLPRMRRLIYGTPHVGDGISDDNKVRTNLIFATIATLLPHVYAKNPEICVEPGPAVGKGEYAKIRDWCDTSEAVLDKLLVNEAALKERAKSNVRSAMGTSVGWLKLNFQDDIAKGDPLILRRVNDLQDNLRRLEYLSTIAGKETDPNKLNEQRAEIAEQLKTINASNEISIYKGFALDRVSTEDMFILDESVRDFDDYKRASALAHRVWMDDDEFRETFGFSVPKGAAAYTQPQSNDYTDEKGAKLAIANDAQKHYRACYEVWDKKRGTRCVVAEGVPGYCRPPSVPKFQPERFYPFYCLGFNIVEGRWRPLSDVELLQHLQDEYNQTRYLFAETRKEAIPVRFFRKGGNLNDDDVKKVVNRKAREMIGIEGVPTVPLSNDIMQLEGFDIKPEAFDVTLIRNDMDMLVGLSDASRANLIEAKTATEAEIMRQSLMTRVAERQDCNEQLISEMAQAALQIAVQAFDESEIKEFVGEGAVWPKIPNTQLFHKINVRVRAGSTGRPNEQLERETWTKLMPVIADSMKQVLEARMNGQFDLANGIIELLKETLKRFDERINVDEFIPEQELDANGQPVAMNNAMAQVQQMQAQVQQMQADNEALQKELAKKEMDLKLAKDAEQARIAEAEMKKAIETANAQAKQFVDAERERASIEAETVRHNERISREAEVAARRHESESALADDRLEQEREIKQEEIAMRERVELAKIAASIVNAGIAAATKGVGGEGAEGETKGMSIEKIMELVEKAAGVLRPDLVGATRRERAAEEHESMVANGMGALQEHGESMKSMVGKMHELMEMLSAEREVTGRRNPDGSMTATSKLKLPTKETMQ